MKIIIVTDAWEPQVNGVVRTLGKTRDYLKSFGHDVTMITPQRFKTVPCPSYPSIRLAILPYRKLARILRDKQANAIHIATEGPLGQAARRWCLRHHVRFTTSYHTQFPEYLRLRAPIPLSWSYAFLRRFHQPAERTLVPTKSQQTRLQSHGFDKVEVWGRGVDTQVFQPENPVTLDLPKPIFVNMGRVAVEKNIEAFLDLDLPGSKLVIGDGPDKAQLEKRYPDVVFAGAKFGEELASWLAGCDVFVFPSKTDTFGLVILEAMACGLPVAAYPVTGPIDIIDQGSTGWMDDNLQLAAQQALTLNKADCIYFAGLNSWTACSREFESKMFNNTPEPPANALTEVV
ncbi:Glycosyltransferase [Methylophaga frappieri]|uniref:Glycosyltransferase n=1 Tax=Methylophaga frappieri (strain ATCC BAA-2434 / DSM 25690 / JAM7) TaxID=754477 RepID=I1YIA6_METFJ|nr:glycosyltransferase family 1 protein [Methylophaga frappieri]AFJ02649.1 Glycosyltransferase [Methylophaga frappieri]